MSDESIITLIGSKLAKMGTEFVFRGEAKECENCKLRNTCLNLEENIRYRVTELVKETVHECYIHEDGVKAVRVVQSPIIAAISVSSAFEGSNIVFKPPECNENCRLYDLCHPQGAKPNETYKISKVIGNSPEECPLGYDLRLAELSPT